MANLEIVNNLIENQENELNQLIADECDCPTLIDKLKENIKKFKKIKQDLDNYKGCLQLIKELFNEIEIDCEPEYYTNKYGEEVCEDVCTIKHNNHYFHITEELYDILYDLKKGYIKDKVGDIHE